MSENALFTKIPLLSSSKDYTKWALAIHVVVQYATIFCVLNGTSTLPTYADPTAPTTKETTAIEKWQMANEKATGLIS
jgi:hypothetical protein